MSVYVNFAVLESNRRSLLSLVEKKDTKEISEILDINLSLFYSAAKFDRKS